MNETSAAKGKKEKVGPDGLTKKERRALKVADKSNESGEGEKNVPPSNIKEKVDIKKVNEGNKKVNPNEKNVSPPKIKEKVDIKKVNEGNKKLNVNDKIKVVNKCEEKSNDLNSKTEKTRNEKEDNEKIKGNANVDDKKVSKKERRAMKVAEKKDGSENKPVVNNIQNKPSEVQKQVSVNKQEKAQNGDIKENVEPKDQVENEGKSKAQLRAERRELQEKQRLAKLAAKDGVKKEEKEPVKKSPSQRKMSIKKIFVKKYVMAGQVQLFNHLHFTPLTAKERSMLVDVHPAFIKLGAQYASKTILGSNARCLALLSALKELIEDFVTPPNQDLCRSLESCLQISVGYLQKCRPFAVSMTNALRHFKVHCTQIKTDISDVEKKQLLQTIVSDYINDEIRTAGRAISLKVSEKITNEDMILTYGCSSLVMKILTDARKEGKCFKVIVVDSRPLFEGREMLRKLVNADISCSYTLINASSYIMRHATKVLLGAHSLLANGHVMARNGTAQVALVARAYNKPVLVCCETYKFCERVQTDSIVFNEIGYPVAVLESSDEKNISSPQKRNVLTPLNLMYDVTPPDLVTAVVTELGFLPCTSVPVVLRIKPTE